MNNQLAKDDPEMTLVKAALKKAKLPIDLSNVIGRNFLFARYHGSHHALMAGTITGITFNDEGNLVLNVSNRTSALTGPNEIAGIHHEKGDQWFLISITHRAAPPEGGRLNALFAQNALFAPREPGTLRLL